MLRRRGGARFWRAGWPAYRTPGAAQQPTPLAFALLTGST
jgi:hypothetical protein